MHEEANFGAPVPVGSETIGLEFLFSQSSEDFDAHDHYVEARETLQRVDEGEEVDDSAEIQEADEEDDGYRSEEVTVPQSA